MESVTFCCLCSQTPASPAGAKVQPHPRLPWTLAKVSAARKIKQMQMLLPLRCVLQKVPREIAWCCVKLISVVWAQKLDIKKQNKIMIGIIGRHGQRADAGSTVAAHFRRFQRSASWCKDGPWLSRVCIMKQLCKVGCRSEDTDACRAWGTARDFGLSWCFLNPTS